MANRHYVIGDEVETDYIKELAGPSPEFRLTETDQTDPAGRWRLRLNDDILSIDRAATAEWGTFTSPITLDSAGIATLSSANPRLRFAETDQTDPAGRFQLAVTLDQMVISRATAANFATLFDWVVFNNAGSTATGAQSITVSGALIAGNGETQGTTEQFAIQGNLFRTLTAATAVTLSALYLDDLRIDTNSNLTGTPSVVGVSIEAPQLLRTAGTPVVTDFRGFWLGPVTVGASLTLTTLYGLYVSAPTVTGTLTNAYGIRIEDMAGGGTINVGIALGTDGDIALHHRTATLAANTALGGALVGTVVGQALAADSFILSNITAAGDIAFYWNRGGNSEQFLFGDGSANALYLNNRTWRTLSGTLQGQTSQSWSNGTQSLDWSGTTNVLYLGTGNVTTWSFQIGGTAMFNMTATDFAFQQATTIAFGAFNSTISASSAGVARSITYDITVAAGGAANAQLSQQFQLDSVFEAGLSGETDGAGGVTAATQVWKVPYRDSGVTVAAPAALNVEVLGGMRVEAGDDTNRIYFRANAAWHYINQTAGLSITAEERVDPWTQHRWEVGDIGLVRMHKSYGDGGADFLPYPLEEGLRETLLHLLDVDAEFRQSVRERLEVPSYA